MTNSTPPVGTILDSEAIVIDDLAAMISRGADPQALVEKLVGAARQKAAHSQ